MLLAQMPHMLRDILTRTIGRDLDVVVVGGDDPSGTLVDQVTRHAPDVLVMTEPASPDQGSWQQVLAERPRLKVLSIEGGGRTGSLYELTPRRTLLGTMSPDLLSDWIHRSGSPLPLLERHASSGEGRREADAPSTELDSFRWPDQGREP